jgi:hypothetical protein
MQRCNLPAIFQNGEPMFEKGALCPFFCESGAEYGSENRAATGSKSSSLNPVAFGQGT